MKLTLDQLKSHVKSQQLKPLYWISGDEPLLRNQASDQLREAARQAGFEAREKFVVDARFDWTPVLTTLQTPSLFAQKKRLEIDFTLVKLNKSLTDGVTALLQEIESYPQSVADNLIIISSQKLEARHAQSAWHKKLLALGAHFPVWPVPRHQLPSWINNRFKHAGLNCTAEVAETLADQIEGNLLAAQQEIDKLALLHGQADSSKPVEITLAHLQQAISDRAQYSTFDFVDAILAGKPDQALRRLNRLRDTGAEPVLILWALTRELRILLRGKNVSRERGQEGVSLNEWLKKERILPTKQKLVSAAIKRLQDSPIEQALGMCQEIDLAIKGRAQLCPWLGLAQIATAIAMGDFDSISQHLAMETESSGY